MGIKTTQPGQGPSVRLLNPGEIAEVSGDYLIVNRDGGDTSKTRWVGKGDRMPPTARAGQRYRLRPITPIYTTVASAQSIAATATDFRTALERLAKK
jgi:hypothetical protein